MPFVWVYDGYMAEENQFPWFWLVPIGFALVLVVGGFFVYQSTRTAQQEQQPVACTMEAMQCPNGSYVGRTGPNCEFADCPAINQSLNLQINGMPQ